MEPAVRDTFVAEACGDNEELRCKVQGLLAVALKADSFFGDDNGATLGAEEFKESYAEKEGDEVGPYKLRQAIGEGGFGMVWMAEQSVPISRMVALKVIKAGMDTKQVLARFEAERQALAMMDHPNIAKVLDAGATAAGRPWFAMELVKGIPITDYCNQAGLTTRERLALFHDVCSAINHAHQKGIIHRDIKPSNVMVSLHSDKPVVKVIDFGIAKATQGKLTDQTFFTRFDQIIGTPAYMSPEQAGLSGQDIDTRSDIYALGILLYELLVGKPPFDAKLLVSAGYEEMRRIIREEEPMKPSSRLNTLSGEERTFLAKTRQVDETKLTKLVEPDLDWIVMRSIEKDRTLRYETANAFAQDIVRYLSDEPVSAGPPSVIYRMKKFARRNQRGLLSGAAVALALLTGLAVAGGIWWDSLSEKNERVNRALTLIAQAENSLVRNAESDIDDDRHFREAREVERRVEESLSGIESLDLTTRKRRENLLQAVGAEQHARELVSVIDEVMTQGISYLETSNSDTSTKAQILAKAFAAFGIVPFEGTVEDTVARIQVEREPLRDRMLAGFSVWSDALEKSSPQQATRLEEIIDRADTDPWRRELRQTIKAGDVAGLETLAKREDVAKQPIITVLQLSTALEEKQLAGPMEKLLRRAQSESPASYWSNFILGSTLMAGVNRKEGEDIRSKYLSIGESSMGSELVGAIPKENPERPEFAEAIGFLRAAAAARPQATTPWVMLGVALSGSGHLDEAVACYQRAFALDPKEELIDFLLGNALLAQGRHKDALPYVRRYAERTPAGDDLIHFQLGTTLAQLGEYEEGRSVLIHYFKRQSEKRQAPAAADDPNAGQRHDKFTFLGKETKPTEEHAYLFLALAQNGRGDSQEALASAQRALDFNPKSAGAQTIRGVELIKIGEWDAAEVALKKAIEWEAGMAAAYNFLTMVLMAKKDLEGAIALARKGIELDTKNASAHCTLGAYLIEIGKLDEANVSTQTAIDLAPDYAQAWNNLGAIRERQGKKDEALEHFRKAALLDPRNTTDARANLAKMLLKMGKHDEAIAVYHELNDANAYVVLAGWFKTQKRIDDAIDVLKRAIAVNPNLAVAHYDLGDMYLNSGRYPDAIEPLSTAIRLDPGMKSAYSLLGFAFMTNENYEESINAIMKAIQLDPDSPSLKNKLLNSLLASGRISVAGLAHGSCSDEKCSISVLLEKDKQLREILAKDGPEAAELPAVLDEIYQEFSRSPFSLAVNRPYPEKELRAAWDERREEIARYLASATVRLIQIRKPSNKHPEASEEELRSIAAGILQQLKDGSDFSALAEQNSEGWAQGKTQIVTYGELPEPLNEAAFALEKGEFTREMIEDEHAFYLLKVESRQAGEAADFKDSKVQEAVKAFLGAQWRANWERRYLERLQDKKPDLAMSKIQKMAAYDHMKAGDFDKAEKLLEQAFAMQLAELGAEDPQTLNTMSVLAICRLRLGKREESTKMFMEQAALCQKVLGPEHPDTLMAVGNLAICHFQAGRRDEAIKLQEETLRLNRKVFGPEHAQTMLALNALGAFYTEHGRKEDALKLKHEIDAINRKVEAQQKNAMPAAATTTVPAPTPGAVLAALKNAALQAWSGEVAAHDANRRQMLAGAASTTNADIAERVAKLASLRPIADAETQQSTLLMARRALELARKSGEPGPWQQMTLGMAEYRSGRFQEAEATLHAVAGMMDAKTYRPSVIQGTADFYRAMSLFQLGRKEEAKALCTAAEAKMKPFPADEKNPLAKADYDDLTLWLACREAKALLHP